MEFCTHSQEIITADIPAIKYIAPACQKCRTLFEITLTRLYSRHNIQNKTFQRLSYKLGKISSEILSASKELSFLYLYGKKPGRAKIMQPQKTKVTLTHSGQLLFIEDSVFYSTLKHCPYLVTLPSI